MKLLGIVLARKNSQRLKNKHHCVIQNKKMINHTLDLLDVSKNFFANVIVSTDDKKILDSKKKYTKFIFLKRPKYLSLNGTKSYQVIRYIYKWYLQKYGNIDGIFIFQPTSPLRTKLTVSKIINSFKKNKMKRSIVSVSPISEHPEWMLKIKKNKIIPNVNFKSFSNMSQRLEKLYKVNGLGYLITPKDIVSQKSLIPENSIPSISSSQFENIDIDTKDDLIKARLFFGYMNKKK
tara:strand:- start:690 stop:1394 length:705 start_codon:yes stop_codon:yes gene_type:complete